MQPQLQGKQVLLRSVRKSDIDDRTAIGRHHEFVHMCGGESLPAPEFPDRKVWENWYVEQKRREENEYSWIIDLGDKCIGCAGLHHLSEADKSATYRIGIFDPQYHAKGIGTEVTGLVLQFGFESLHLHRIDLKVLDYNKRAIRCYEKLGFRRIGCRREAHWHAGQWHGIVMMDLVQGQKGQ